MGDDARRVTDDGRQIAGHDDASDERRPYLVIPVLLCLPACLSFCLSVCLPVYLTGRLGVEYR